MIDIFNEILWPQFVKLEHIKNLPLNEQTSRYNRYVNELSYRRRCYIQQQNWLNCNKGGRPKENTLPEEEIFFLLNENDDNILQENGDNIIVD